MANSVTGKHTWCSAAHLPSATSKSSSSAPQQSKWMCLSHNSTSHLTRSLPASTSSTTAQARNRTQPQSLSRTSGFICSKQVLSPSGLTCLPKEVYIPPKELIFYQKSPSGLTCSKHDAQGNTTASANFYTMDSQVPSTTRSVARRMMGGLSLRPKFST